jgi:hypothetical protein
MEYEEYIEEDLLNDETNKNKTVPIQPVQWSVFRVRYLGYIVKWLPEVVPSQNIHKHTMSYSEYLTIYHYLSAKVLRINKQVCMSKTAYCTIQVVPVSLTFVTFFFFINAHLKFTPLKLTHS